MSLHSCINIPDESKVPLRFEADPAESSANNYAIQETLGNPLGFSFQTNFTVSKTFQRNVHIRVGLQNDFFPNPLQRKKSDKDPLCST